jgi:hypothetical protein
VSSTLDRRALINAGSEVATPLQVALLASGIVERIGSADTVASEVCALFGNRRRLIVHVLSLALLIAQLGIQAHAYSHLKPDSDGLPGSTQLCGQCLSSAPLTSMAGGTHCIRVPHQTETIGIAPAGSSSVLHRLPYPAFRSRAPPRLL